MAPDGGTATTSPSSTLRLPVGNGHELYVETVGAADGIPAVYLHGGPGSGCQPAHRQLFDPTRFRAVLFDQRGAGRSTPGRSREANTTAHLVADMEQIRIHFGIERWLVVGGSWGATLALAYAETHPERVLGIVLRATFLGTRSELEWAFGTGLSTFYPALYEDFLSLLTPEERLSPVDSYFRRILDPDPAIHAPAARAYGDTERILSEVRPATTRLDFSPSSRVPATAVIEAHYFSHDSFMAPDQLLSNAHRLAGIRGIIVQGRYDLLCPPRTAHALAAIWTDAEVRVIDNAGHALSDPGITEAVTVAVRSFAS